MPACACGVVACAFAGSRVNCVCLPLCCCVCGVCSCSLGYNRIGDAGAAAIGAGLVYLPQLRTLEYVVCSAVCAEPLCALARERGVMASECGGHVVCAGVCLCSLRYIGIGGAGAAAIGAGLAHLSQLQALKCVVCPSLRAGLWCVLARERG